jgi:transcriptional regulator with XRE-family HTH domain
MLLSNADPSTPTETFGARLRKLREAAGFSTSVHLAAAVGINRTTVWRLENDKRKTSIRLGTLQRLARALGVTAAEMVGGTAEQAHPGPLHERLKRLRQAAGFRTARRLALAADVNDVTCYRLESGTGAGPKLDTLEELARALRVHIAVLVGL